MYKKTANIRESRLHHASDKSQEKSKSKKKAKKGQENGELEGFEWIANEKYDMEQHLEKNFLRHLSVWLKIHKFNSVAKHHTFKIRFHLNEAEER